VMGKPTHSSRVPDALDETGAGGDGPQSKGNDASRDAAGRTAGPPTAATGNSGGAIGSGR